MDQIVADGVAPVLTRVFRRIGLIEQVPASLPEAETVGIVQTAFRIHVMIDRAMRIAGLCGSRLDHSLQQGIRLELFLLLGQRLGKRVLRNERWLTDFGPRLDDRPLVQRRLAGCVRLHDLIDIDVPPAARCRCRRSESPPACRPTHRHPTIASRALLCPSTFRAGPTAVRTTFPSTSRLMQVASEIIPRADQEVDVAALDRERRRGERSRRRVSVQVGVDQPLALMTGNAVTWIHVGLGPGRSPNASPVVFH